MLGKNNKCDQGGFSRVFNRWKYHVKQIDNILNSITDSLKTSDLDLRSLKVVFNIRVSDILA